MGSLGRGLVVLESLGLESASVSLMLDGEDSCKVSMSFCLLSITKYSWSCRSCSLYLSHPDLPSLFSICAICGSLSKHVSELIIRRDCRIKVPALFILQHIHPWSRAASACTEDIPYCLQHYQNFRYHEIEENYHGLIIYVCLLTIVEKLQH